MSENAMLPRSIIVRIPNWVGDAVMATPALRSLRLGYPRSRIVLQGKPKILSLLRGLDSFDETIPLEGSGSLKVLRWALTLRPYRFEMGILLPNSFSSALAFLLGKVRYRVGYGMNGRSWMLNNSIPLSARARKRNPNPMTEYYLDVVRFAGGADVGEKVELAVDSDSEEQADAFLRRTGLGERRPLVGLNAGAAFGPSKRWTPEGFAGVADLVHSELGGNAVLLCGPGEEEIADAIMASARTPLTETSRSVLPLDVLKSVMRRLDLLVTTDTGPRHLAVAFDVPAVVLMGPTDPRYTAVNLERTRVVRIDVDCAPCHKKECDRDQVCMKGITCGMVVDQIKELLEISGARAC